MIRLKRKRGWSLLMAGLLCGGGMQAVEQNPMTRQEALIQQEAHKLVERLTRQFPGTEFTFVLTNQPEVAALVSENLHSLSLQEEVSRKIQREKKKLDDLVGERENLQVQGEQLEEQRRTVLASVRKMYLELAGLEEQHDQLVAGLTKVRKESQELYEERNRVSLELTHLRSVSERLKAVLMEVPDFMTPQRVQISDTRIREDRPVP